MTQLYIEQILKIRMAVYQAGISVGIWKDINQLGASDMMEYIFPKSGQIAYYNLIMEYMRKEHDVITGGAYFLYKMPVQIEKEIMEYLKKAGFKKVLAYTLGYDVLKETSEFKQMVEVKTGTDDCGC